MNCLKEIEKARETKLKAAKLEPTLSNPIRLKFDKGNRPLVQTGEGL
jgi:hypothetical protein